MQISIKVYTHTHTYVHISGHGSHLCIVVHVCACVSMYIGMHAYMYFLIYVHTHRTYICRYFGSRDISHCMDVVSEYYSILFVTSDGYLSLWSVCMGRCSVALLWLNDQGEV